MKKSKKILLSFMTGAMLFSVLPNVASAHSNPLSVDEGEKKEISNEIEQLLESRAAIMVSDGQVLHESQYFDTVEGEELDPVDIEPASIQKMTQK